MFAFNSRPLCASGSKPLSYFPLSLFHWEDAIKAVVKGSLRGCRRVRSGRAEPVDACTRLPSVIALRDYVRPPSRVLFTRFNVFLRDRFRCQYCGDQQLKGELTFDRILQPMNL